MRLACLYLPTRSFSCMAREPTSFAALQAPRMNGRASMLSGAVNSGRNGTMMKQISFPRYTRKPSSEGVCRGSHQAFEALLVRSDSIDRRPREISNPDTSLYILLWSIHSGSLHDWSRSICLQRRLAKKIASIDREGLEVGKLLKPF